MDISDVYFSKDWGVCGGIYSDGWDGIKWDGMGRRRMGSD